MHDRPEQVHDLVNVQHLRHPENDGDEEHPTNESSTGMANPGAVSGSVNAMGDEVGRDGGNDGGQGQPEPQSVNLSMPIPPS